MVRHADALSGTDLGIVRGRTRGSLASSDEVPGVRSLSASDGKTTTLRGAVLRSLATAARSLPEEAPLEVVLRRGPPARADPGVVSRYLLDMTEGVAGSILDGDRASPDATVTVGSSHGDPFLRFAATDPDDPGDLVRRHHRLLPTILLPSEPVSEGDGVGRPEDASLRLTSGDAGALEVVTVLRFRALSCRDGRRPSGPAASRPPRSEPLETE